MVVGKWQASTARAVLAGLGAEAATQLLASATA